MALLNRRMAPNKLLAAFIAAAILALGLLFLGRGASADETLVTPEGVTITVNVPSVTAQQVHDWLRGAGLEAHVGLTEVTVVDSGLTHATGGGGCFQGQCWVYPASIQFTDDALLSAPRYTTGHEYGHVWA